jgi:hypothetical protein
MSRSIPPSVTPPSPNEWPVTYRAITFLLANVQTVVLAPNHGFTTANDVGVTRVDFTQVKGMPQINGKTGLIAYVITPDIIVVDINSTFFSPFGSGGFLNIVSGNPPYDPFQNIA